MRFLSLFCLFLPSLASAMPNEPVKCQSVDGTISAQLSTWRSSGNPDGDGVGAEVNGVSYSQGDEKNPAWMGMYWSDSEGTRMKIMMPGGAFGEFETAALVFVTQREAGKYPAKGTLEVQVQEIMDMPWKTVLTKEATCSW